jgi:hypothetical protein
MSNIDWVRPSGSVISLADTENMAEYAKSNGWVKKKSVVKAAAKPKAKPKAKKVRDDDSTADS